MKSGSNLERLLTAGQFVVCGELGPPQSANGEAVKKKVKNFLGFVDAVNLTDNQSAIVRMSSIASAILVMQHGLEPVIQMTCRDRNRIAIQSDILGASAFGIKNILCLSGDHMRIGNHPAAKPVFDMDSTSLIALVKQMRDEKKFQNGEEMKVEPRMFIGGASNPFAEPFDWRIHRLEKKIEAGLDFVQTQAVFDLARFEAFMSDIIKRGLHKHVSILAGVLPVRSVNALKRMKEDVPGMLIPEELFHRLGKAEGKEAQMEAGVDLCSEIMQKVQGIEGVAGVHIMPVMWESITPALVERAGMLPRPTLPPLVPEEETSTDK